jgi:hypothetical protein
LPGREGNPFRLVRPEEPSDVYIRQELATGFCFNFHL